MPKRSPRIFSPSGSGDITSNYFPFATETRATSIDSCIPLLVAKITRLLHKRFGQMPIDVSIGLMERREFYYEVIVRYGIDNSHYICTNVGQSVFIEIYENGGIQILAEILAERLINVIKTNIRDTMFGTTEVKVFKNEENKMEETFRKILI